MSTKFFFNFVQIVSLCCVLFLFIALFKAPREYYWILRAVVFIGALLVIIKNSNNYFWMFLFGLVAILFNPVFPIFLYKKLYWMPLDILTGILFLVEIIMNRPRKENPVPATRKNMKQYKRDRML